MIRSHSNGGCRGGDAVPHARDPGGESSPRRIGPGGDARPYAAEERYDGVHTVSAVVLMPFHTSEIHVVKFVQAVLAAVEMLVHTPLKKATMAFHTVTAVVLIPSHTLLIHSVKADHAVLAVAEIFAHVSENHF